MKKIFFTLCLALTCLSGFSQGEFNTWYFGHHAGLNFNSGSPVVLTNCATNFFEEYISASISDSNGNILFYADASKIYNRNNVVMSNGCCFPILPGVSQPILAFQKLDDDSSYYVFSVDVTASSSRPNPSGLSYSIVDMRLNGGLGGVSATQKNVAVAGAVYASEAVHGTRHRNNKDAWIVVRKYNNSNIFLSYLVNSSGINPVPVQSTSKIYRLPFSADNTNMIKISPDGSKMVCVYDTLAEFGNFNTLTGQFTPLFLFNYYSPSSSPISEQSFAEFSIDSKFVYISAFGDNPNHNYLVQYDATKTDSLQFIQSGIVIHDFLTVPAAGLQMGPDGKIYCAENGSPYLAVINSPSSPGASCNFQLNAVNLLGNDVWNGFCQFIQKYKAYIHNSSICQGEPVSFSGDIWPPADSIRWDFGDPASGGSNYSTHMNPSHTYSTPGTYTVELYVRHNDNRTDTTWKTIHVPATPQPALGPDQTICAGNSVTFDAGACAGCIYQWIDLTTGLPVGNNQSYTTNVAGNYEVIVTNSSGCAGMDTVQLTTVPVPSITNNPLSKSICSGESTNIPLTSNVPGTTFHWTASLTSGTITGFSPDSGLVINQILTNPISTSGIVTYHITPKIGSCAGAPVDYPVTVNPGDSVKVSVTASANNVCSGTPVTFTAVPVNPGASPVYQWKVNGINSGTNSTTFAYTPLNNDVVTCELTSSLTVCVSNNPASSNGITMIINPNLPVSVSVTATANPVCAGTQVTFTATSNNGGTTPSYQWKVNGVNMGSNSPTYSYTPVNGDQLTCVLTSSETTCVTNNPATSNTVSMTVNPNFPVSVSVTASANPVCAGTPVTFTATPNNGGTTPSYQWKVNGFNVGANSPTYSYTPVNGDQLTCVLTSSETTCVTNNPATSNTVSMTVNPNLPVSVSITASANPVCAGTPVTSTATPNNGGTTPSYQWKVNGVNMGANSPTYSYTPVNGDQLTCVLTSSETTCVTNNPATSNTVSMTVNPNLPVSVSVSASANPVCAGTPVTFTATPNNGGTTPSYQWKVNGVNVGMNSPTYTYIPVDNDIVICTLTSSEPCTSGNPASSIQYQMTVPARPVVTFMACFDTITTVNAKPIKLKGGIPIGGTFSGPGVTSGIFYPAIAGVGRHIVTYAYTNVAGCSAMSQIAIVTLTSSIVNCGTPFTDPRDNHIYPTVQIGTQCWMASNLDYGSQISETLPQRDNCTPEKYVLTSYASHPSFYQWDEVVQYDQSVSTQGLCPPGWHVPSEADWNTLFSVYINSGFAGSPLKYSGYSGFNAILSGARHFNKGWDYQGFATFFWSSTPYGPTKAFSHAMNDYDPSVAMYPSYRGNAFSVRCLKD